MTSHNEHTLGETVSEHKVAIGAGLATLVAAAAGAYYLYGSKKAPERRKKLKSWMLRMKADTLEQLEQLKEVNEGAYKAVIESISDKYKKLKDVEPAEVVALAMRMKTHWKDIQKDITGTTKKVGTAAAKRVRKSKAN